MNFNIDKETVMKIMSFSLGSAGRVYAGETLENQWVARVASVGTIYAASRWVEAPLQRNTLIFGAIGIGVGELLSMYLGKRRVEEVAAPPAPVQIPTETTPALPEPEPVPPPTPEQKIEAEVSPPPPAVEPVLPEPEPVSNGGKTQDVIVPDEIISPPERPTNGGTNGGGTTPLLRGGSLYAV